MPARRVVGTRRCCWDECEISSEGSIPRLQVCHVSVWEGHTLKELGPGEGTERRWCNVHRCNYSRDLQREVGQSTEQQQTPDQQAQTRERQQEALIASLRKTLTKLREDKKKLQRTNRDLIQSREVARALNLTLRTEKEPCTGCLRQAAQRQEVAALSLEISYLDVQGACLRREEVDCTVQRAREVPADVAPIEGVALQCARIETAVAMAEARRAAEGGDLVAARAQLQAQLQVCLTQVESVPSVSAFTAQLCQDLREVQRNMVDRQTYATRGSKLLLAKGKAHNEQACRSETESSDEDEEYKERRSCSTFSDANSRTRTPV